MQKCEQELPTDEYCYRRHRHTPESSSAPAAWVTLGKEERVEQQLARDQSLEPHFKEETADMQMHCQKAAEGS